MSLAQTRVPDGEFESLARRRHHLHFEVDADGVARVALELAGSEAEKDRRLTHAAVADLKTRMRESAGKQRASEKAGAAVGVARQPSPRAGEIHSLRAHSAWHRSWAIRYRRQCGAAVAAGVQHSASACKRGREKERFARVPSVRSNAATLHIELTSKTLNK